MHLVGYLYEDYRDARSPEHKINQCILSCNKKNVIHKLATTTNNVCLY